MKQGINILENMVGPWGNLSDVILDRGNIPYDYQQESLSRLFISTYDKLNGKDSLREEVTREHWSHSLAIGITGRRRRK